jgi:hypothetical protein
MCVLFAGGAKESLSWADFLMAHNFFNNKRYDEKQRVATAAAAEPPFARSAAAEEGGNFIALCLT